MSKTQGAKNKDQGNRYERLATRWALKHTSGLHPDVKEIATSTGRVGNYTHLEIDGLFVEYSLESKSKKSLPQWLAKGFKQAVTASQRFKNHPLVVLYTKDLPSGYRTWHFITQERHEELLKYEGIVSERLCKDGFEHAWVEVTQHSDEHRQYACTKCTLYKCGEVRE